MSETPIDLESVTGIEIRDVDLDGQRLRAGIRRARDSTTPLLVFNGIGANLELVQPLSKRWKAWRSSSSTFPESGDPRLRPCLTGSRRWPGSPTS